MKYIYIYILPQRYADITDFNRIQAGCRYSLQGEYFVSGKKGDQQNDWYVIAVNYFGDPFYIDFTQEDIGFPVYFSWCEAGMRTPVKLADTLEEFGHILKMLKAQNFDSSFELGALPVKIDLYNEFWGEADKFRKELEC